MLDLGAALWYNMVMENTSTVDCAVALPYQRGFRFNFANGYTVSIQFGTANYCDVRNYSPNQPEDAPAAGCVEVGIFETDNDPGDGEGGKWIRLSDHDDVAGWVPVDSIPAILSFAQEANWDMVRYAISHQDDDEDMDCEGGLFEDDADALASAGMGTDEDYGCY